jgi:hypothetical protein
MKRLLLGILLSGLIFIGFTIFTAKHESACESDSTFGFPFTFYRIEATHCIPCPPETELIMHNLVFDGLLALGAGAGIMALLNHLKRGLGQSISYKKR